jgi:hypothetical protein
VVSSGADGQEARIRVIGTDFPFPILPGKDPVDPMPVEIVQDYILHPGEQMVTIETTVTNVGRRTLELFQGELLLVGSSLEMSAQGIPPGDLVGRTTYIAMRGSRSIGASYLYANAAGPFFIPFEDAAQTGAILNQDFLRRGKSQTWKRYFFVGDRDAANVTDAWFKFSGERLGTLSGTAVDPSGLPVADALVTLMDADGKYITESRTRSDGTYSAQVPPGDITLRIRAEGRSEINLGGLSIQADKTTSVPLALGAQGRLTFRAVDEQGVASPVRAILTRSGGATTNVPSYKGGETVIVEPGDYTVTLARGPEYSIGSWTVTVPTSGTPALVPPTSPAVLKRVLNTKGWIAGDFHLHQSNSNDSPTLMEQRVTSLLSEGIEVAVPTEHDHVSDFQPTLDALGLSDKLVTAPGNEVSIIDYGHFNYYPVVLDVPGGPPLQGT